MTKRTIILAPVSVNEGAFEYDEGGLLIDGYRRASAQYLQEKFGRGLNDEEVQDDAPLSAKDGLIYDHRWIRTQLTFYGVNPNQSSQGGRGLSIPISELRRRLKEAIADGKVKRHDSFNLSFCSDTRASVRNLLKKYRRSNGSFSADTRER